LEYWNDGILEDGKNGTMEYWNIGNIIPLFHHSIIPSFSDTDQTGVTI
jgi:hypothetical protein